MLFMCWWAKTHWIWSTSHLVDVHATTACRFRLRAYEPTRDVSTTGAGQVSPSSNFRLPLGGSVRG